MVCEYFLLKDENSELLDIFSFLSHQLISFLLAFLINSVDLIIDFSLHLVRVGFTNIVNVWKTNFSNFGHSELDNQKGYDSFSFLQIFVPSACDIAFKQLFRSSPR